MTRESDMTDKCDLVLDLSGIQCPYSMLELNATLRDMRAGATAEIIADRASIVDEIQRWADGTGNEVVSADTGKAEGTVSVRLVVRKA